MLIRKAIYSDLDRIMEIYSLAREYMWKNGNKTQWTSSYPSLDLVKSDIENDVCYVMEHEDEVCAVFSFIIGEDDTYKVIYDGRWLSNSSYGTIHRIASDGSVKGVFDNCIAFCKNKISHIRIDTHENNKIMRYLIEKNEFQMCGIIFVKDGTKRIAYEYYRK